MTISTSALHEDETQMQPFHRFVRLKMRTSGQEFKIEAAVNKNVIVNPSTTFKQQTTVVGMRNR